MIHPPGRDIRELITPHTGRISGITPTDRGVGSDLTAVVSCERGPFFVKAMRNRPGGRLKQLRREESINESVRPLAPALLWTAEDDAWVVLGFERVPGRGADFRPGSPDLPTVVDLVNEIGALKLPTVAHAWHETRWDRWADPGAHALFRGDALLHADINPSNFLVGDGPSWVVDWAWPTRGAAFIDPAMFVVQLVTSGHTPEEAEAIAARCPAWTEADPAALDAFTVATVRMWRHLASRSTEGAATRIATAAEAWARHRGLTPRLTAT